MAVVIRSAYSPRVSVKLVCREGEGRTKQAMKDECNVNNILARFQRTGVIDFINERQPQFGDVTGIDFRSSMETVAKGRELFDELPSNVRKHFNNDPAAFLDFVSDPANTEEAKRIGLIKAAEKAPEEPEGKAAAAAAQPATPAE